MSGCMPSNSATLMNPTDVDGFQNNEVDFGGMQFEEDDDDEDNENAISVEKIKKQVPIKIAFNLVLHILFVRAAIAHSSHHQAHYFALVGNRVIVIFLHYFQIFILICKRKEIRDFDYE